MKRLLLTIILMAAVMVASGCCGTAVASSRPHTKRITNTVKQKKAVKCKRCTEFKCDIPKKRRAKK